MTSPGIVDFLLARFAEDERRAEACHDYSECGPENWETTEDGHTYGCPAHPSVARRLAECDAKRRIVEGFVDAERAVATYDHDHPTDAYWQEWGNRHALALAVELLALPYADHPDYREEWKP